MIGDVELEEVEEYLRAKSAAQVATPVRSELLKLRQASDHPAGLTAALPSSEPASSPYYRGMASYRPGCKSILSFEAPSSPCPVSESKRSKQSDSGSPHHQYMSQMSQMSQMNHMNQMSPAPLAHTHTHASAHTHTHTTIHMSSPKIPFSPARAASSGHPLSERESCPHKLASRQKQIDFGKNTQGYQRYCALVPRSSRKRSDPWTPNKNQVCSKRSWDGQIRKWRRALHRFDPNESSEPGEVEVESVDGGSIDEMGQCDNDDNQE